jgi:hypothetical protein
MRINISGEVGYHIGLRITWNNLIDTDGEEKRVATYDSRLTPPIDIPQTHTYEIPFSVDIVSQLMRHTLDGNLGLTITDLKNQKHYGVKTLDEFLRPDLPKFFEEIDKPKPTYTFDIAPEKLAKHIQMEEAAKEPDIADEPTSTNSPPGFKRPQHQPTNTNTKQSTTNIDPKRLAEYIQSDEEVNKQDYYG